jgi:hypothetical protein
MSWLDMSTPLALQDGSVGNELEYMNDTTIGL